MNVVEVAELCHEANRHYCALLGNLSQYGWHGAPDSIRESAIAGVQFVLAGLRKGIHIAAWDLHNAWMNQKLERGWTPGPTKDPEAKIHPMLVPFDQLPKDEQRKDYLFIGVIEACYRAGIEE
jgi:hypothetical protein